MSIKTKVALGVAFLFAAILTIGGIGLHYLHELAGDTQNIIRNNYETLQYTKRILALTNGSKAFSVDSIEQNILRQESNITEPGERELTIKLRSIFEKYRVAENDSIVLEQLRATALAIQDINLSAIIRKNEVAQATASRASTYVVIILSVFAILAFTFIVNFPGYVANPIIQLTNSIKSIADKNYEERLHFDRKDEFEELAQAFNRMAEKLDEYEHSNLARVIFEKRRIEAIINRMTDPVLGLDERKKIVFANDQALAFLNIPKEQLVGRYAPDVAVENDLLRNLIREGPTKDTESNIIKIVLDGKENYFSKENITVQYIPTGEKNVAIIGQVLLLKNVTPYKELDLAKTNFIATISHELKTPIASLQMCTKLLRDKRVGELNSEQGSITETMLDEINRLSKITHELLDLAQVETGNIKLNIRSVSPREIIEYAQAAIKFQAERKRVAITVDIAESVDNVHADMDKTTWVLINLLTNAIRYSPEGGEIILRCHRQQNAIVFSVQDFGSGIEAKFKNRLFEKFFQVPGTPSGTGLGLSISKEFIESQGGKITVESDLGKGSLFAFELSV
ncbi:HAMP domain-containing sensor histidine kinase [Ohtaekwangia koreensis]|uniref:histidine kinase n=1 Tax=Ohtaekwangia koreensis TaxID=688867 RepID=A0A1T5MB03_9BACT|nr:ATP-binding protein [Ohtaekwangia koreensis]SKC85421.1 Signal transduction histidine kinase [Ohtaekwangia koreensis]